jgi:hypothetical protein
MPSHRVYFGCNWTLKTLVYAEKTLKINVDGGKFQRELRQSANDANY